MLRHSPTLGDNWLGLPVLMLARKNDFVEPAFFGELSEKRRFEGGPTREGRRIWNRLSTANEIGRDS
jgi:hypothetical protein